MVILLIKTKEELWNYGNPTYNPTYKNQRRTMVILLIKTKEELW